VPCEEGAGGVVITDVGGERRVRGELHHGGADAVGLRLLERDGVAEVSEPGLAEQFLVGGAEATVGNAVHAEGLAGVSDEGRDVGAANHGGAGAVEEKVAPGNGIREGGVGGAAVDADSALDNAQLREAALEHAGDRRGEVGGSPEHDLGGGDEPFEQCEQAGRVGDIADVDDLPGGAEEDAGSGEYLSAHGRWAGPG